MKCLVLILVATVAMALPQSRRIVEVYQGEPQERQENAGETAFPEEDYGTVDGEIVQEDGPSFDNIPGYDVFGDSRDNGGPIFVRPVFHGFRSPGFRVGTFSPWPFRTPSFEDDVSSRPSLFDILFRDFARPNFRPFHPQSFPFHPRGGDDVNSTDFKISFGPFFNDRIFDDMPSFKFDNTDFPANYSNSTSDVHDIDGTQYLVNQTIKKTTGDNFNSFFHVRTIHVLPNGDILVPDQQQSDDEGLQPEIVFTGNEGPMTPENNAYETDIQNNDQEIPDVINERENEVLPMDSNDQGVSQVIL